MLEINQIYNMDCIEGMKLIDDKSIDMIFTDLPYGVTAQNKWDTVIPFEPLWEQFERIIKDNGAILLFGQDKFSAKLMLSNEKLHRYNIIWKKTTPTGFLNANRMPLRTHEDIMVFYKSLPTYNPQKTIGHKRKVSTAEHKRTSTVTNDYGKHGLTTYDSTERFPTSVWEFPTDKQKSAIHPTQKPVDLCRYAIRTYSNEGDLILDCCCGSGSIPLAVKLENRSYIGFDNGLCEKKNSKYYGRPWATIAKERIEEYEVNGSKSRITKYIVPIIQKCINDNHITCYYEPFVGGANVIDKVRCEKKYGNDLNKYLIALLEYVANGGKLLDEVPRELYSEVRANYKSEKYEDWYVGNIGFLASYNGRWFDGGYAKAGYEHTKNGDRYRDYYQEAKKNLEEQSKFLTNIFFTSKDYRELSFIKASFIYVDPPYANRKQFANATNFDYSEFWKTVREWSKDNYVLVSEENAPDDFECVWEQSVSRSIKSTDKSRSTEKLFTYKNGLYKSNNGAI